MSVIIKILIIFWNCALLLLPYWMCKFGVSQQLKKYDIPVPLKVKLMLYGECLFTAILFPFVMLQGSSNPEEPDTNFIIENYESIISSVIVILIASVYGCTEAIIKHEQLINKNKSDDN